LSGWRDIEMMAGTTFFRFRENKAVWLLFLLALLSRVIAMPFAEVTDADAVTRIYMAEKWLLDPHLISEGIWLPFHHYFNAIALWFWSDSWYSPMLFHSILASLTVFPLYHFTKREFHERGARLAVLVYIFSAVVFHNSFHALSELPNAVFIMFALDQMSLLVREKRIKHAVLAGLYMTIAAGFRYESWMLIAIFSGMLLLFRVPIRSIFVFGFLASIFPLFWMLGNYIAHKDLFFGLSGAYHWNVVMEGVNDNIDGVEKIKRLLFFPLSWVMVFSPVLILWLFIRFIRRLISRSALKSEFIWMLPFLFLLATFIFKSYEGTLLNQHRFTILPLLLSVPFVALILDPVKAKWMDWLAYLSIPACFFLSFSLATIEGEKWIPSQRIENAVRQIRLSTFSTLGAIPRQTDPFMREVVQRFPRTTKENHGFLGDFWTWEASFYLALRTGKTHQDIYLVDGAANGIVYELELRQFLKKHKSLTFYAVCNSKLTPYYEVSGDTVRFNVLDQQFNYFAKCVYSKDGMQVLELDQKPSTGSKRSCNCPEANSTEAYRMNIRQNLTWLNDVKVKAKNNKVDLNEMLDKEAEWLVNNP